MVSNVAEFCKNNEKKRKDVKSNIPMVQCSMSLSSINNREEKGNSRKKKVHSVLEIRNFSWKFEFFAFDRKISQQTKIEKIYLPEIYPMFKINNFSVG